uniref:Uncharacterized protein n=1 Tax=Solanum lycopersicum TaxID=4081 RepID=A0A3Q7HKF2_SOLLC
MTRGNQAETREITSSPTFPWQKTHLFSPFSASQQAATPAFSCLPTRDDAMSRHEYEQKIEAVGCYL